MSTNFAKLPPKGALVAVAMSGGVDSSAAALLIQRAGYQAVGVTMKLWSPPVTACSTDSADKTCCTVDSAMDAKRVCDQIGIPHFTLDMQDDFEARVIQPFYEAYLQGETPNPCVNCNSFVKWDALWKRAKSVGAEYLATGHYATVLHEGERAFIERGSDPAKDQSYFLWGIPPVTLMRTLFPLAALTKPEVRALATEAGLRTAQKSESQDICFIPDGNYRTFIADRAKEQGLSPEAGRILGPDGEDRGAHLGLPYYTIGQRKGIGVATGEPVFVKKLDRATNTLLLGRKDDLYSQGFHADRLNFFGDDFDTLECQVQYRYRAQTKQGILKNLGDGKITVTLKEPGYCVSPGQSAVFYDGAKLLGGARIREVIY